MPNENNHDERNDTMRGGETGAPQGGPTTRGDESRVPTGMEPTMGGIRGPEGVGNEGFTGRSGEGFSGRSGEPVRGTGGAEASGPRPKQRRGFAAMDPAKQREIASKGGKASHEQGTGHEWDSEAAREAGRKGGQASRGGRGKLRGPTGTPGGEGGGI